MVAEVVPFKREDGDWDWHLVGDNGEILCGSVQGFTERNDMIENLQLVARLFMGGVRISGEEEISESGTVQVRPSEEAEVSDQQHQESS